MTVAVAEPQGAELAAVLRTLTTAEFVGGPARLDAAKRAYQSVGAKLKDFYLVTGPYDAVAIVEAPDDEAAVAISFGIASRGATGALTERS